ncbi:PTS sugar transporter subunit IIBC [Chryseobacterium aquaticum]|uniref:PTS sugar transporter subunit IIBC n=1 Tax=Chryseobacterium aquaticum TaxID=452084 RepID=A0A0Q3HTW8_9FLAO|nr:PTS sugar transporter subunit IIBC [Chryseobacterium aquaticum]
MNFIDRNVSVEQAIIILAKNGVQVNEKEAKIILELLYLVSKSYNQPKEKNIRTLLGFQTTPSCR